MRKQAKAKVGGPRCRICGEAMLTGFHVEHVLNSHYSELRNKVQEEFFGIHQ